MRKFRNCQAREQILLLPASIEEYVSKEDSVRYLDVIVDQLEIGSIEGEYSYEGRPAYSPRILIKLIFFGKLRGIRSSRQLARAARENLRAMYLLQGERPDYRTIALFRKRFIGELAGFLKQTVRIGIKEGYISLEEVAIDGTKIRANASGKSFRTPEKLEARLQELEKELIKSLEQDVAIDEKEDKELGESNDGESKLPQELQNKAKLADKIRKSLEHLKECEKKPEQVSMEEPESRFMKGRQGSHPSYNAQAVVDGKSKMVVAGYVTNAGSDHGEMTQALKETHETSGRDPQRVLTDAGYGAGEGLAELNARGIDGYVPLQETNTKRIQVEEFTYDKEADSYTCPVGRILEFQRIKDNARVYQSSDCSNCPLSSKCLTGKANRSLKISPHAPFLEQMRNKMSADQAKAKARIRGSIVEALFGNLKVNKQLRQFLLRGLDNVSNCWKLELAAINIEKIIGFRRRAEAAAIP